MPSGRFPRQSVRKLEKCDVFPLVALEGVGELRRFLDEIEAESIVRAKALGATSEDIASHMGITRQGAHYKLKFSEQRLEKVRAGRQKRGEPTLQPIDIGGPSPAEFTEPPSRGGGEAGSR
jgi:hypothetical protein